MRDYDDETLARWFGEGVDTDDAHLALNTLDEQLRQHFATPVYKSPGYTGILCWKKRYGQDWEPLPVEQQQLIRSTTTQGRFQCLPVLDVLPAVHCLDLRLAYAASAITIKGAREWRHETRPEGGWSDGHEGCAGFLGYAPGRYRVRFSVPENWGHVGILPVQIKYGWDWPTEGEWETWADGREVLLAIGNGWGIEVMERLVGVAEGKSHLEPLRSWAENLIALRDELAQGAQDPKLYRTAIRNVIVQGIGMFAKRPAVEKRTVGSRDEMPMHQLADETYEELDTGEIQFDDYVTSAGLKNLLHPEFGAAVWADTRVKLLRNNGAIHGKRTLTGILQLPREQVVGTGLDCAYLTGNPGWPDDERVGRFRVKWSVQGPLPAPRSRRDLEAMGKAAEGGA